MSCFGNTNVNETFIIEPVGESLSACTGVYTNIIGSCTGNTEILLGTNTIKFIGQLSGDSIVINSISATTYQNLPIDIRVTGGTYSNGTATFKNNTGGTFTVSGFTVTSGGGTFTGGTVSGATNFINGLTANTISATTYQNLPIDIRVTGGTYSGSSIIFKNNTGGTFTVSGITSGGGTFTGGTVSGATNFISGLTANTLTLNGLTSLDDYNVVTINSDTNVLSKRLVNFTPERVVLSQVDLGSRVAENTQLPNQLIKLLTTVADSFLFNGVKIDYYYSLTDSIQKRILFATQVNGVNYNPSIFNDLLLFITDNYGNIVVNFYVEAYFEIESNSRELAQIKLVNPLFNSLNNQKYSTKNYGGNTQYIRAKRDKKHTDNTENTYGLFSEFVNGWVSYYDVNSAEDIPKNIYNLILNNNFYGPLSGESQTLFTNSGTTSWSTEIRDSIKNSVYVESLKNFKSKFKIPVNLYGHYGVNYFRYNNFYGNLDFKINISEPDIIWSLPTTPDSNSKAFLHLIDNYRIYSNGNIGYIYTSGTANSVRLNELSNIIDAPSKYISERAKPTSEYENLGKLQIIPRYSENYILKVNVFSTNVSPVTTQEQFLKDMFNDYFVCTDTSNKTLIYDNNFIPWTKILKDAQSYLTNKDDFDTNPYGPYILIQSNDEKIDKLKTNRKWGTSIGEMTYIGGGFFNVLGGTQQFIAKLNSQGNRRAPYRNGITQVAIGNGVYSTVIQDDGKIIIGGYFNEVTNYGNNSFTNSITRFNPDGTLDTNFISGFGFNIGDTVFTIKIQKDGKILIGGDLTGYNGVSISNIIRLNQDGNIDLSFNTNGFTNTVYSIDLQSDGKIIVGGNFTYSNDGFNTYYLARLDTNGNFDTTFTIDSGTDSTIRSIFVDADDNIFLGGLFSQYIDINGSNYDTLYIVKLLPNGLLNYSFSNLPFNVGFDGNSVNKIKIISDKIYVCGLFNSHYFNGLTTSCNNFAVLNLDGSFSSDFLTNVGPEGEANDFVIQSDGKIIIGGNFAQYSDNVSVYSTAYLVRINPDGSYDNTYDTSNFSDYIVYSLANTVNEYTAYIGIDAVYKSHSFMPSIYPLNQTQLMFELPKTYFYDNNLIEDVFIDNDVITNKLLRLILNFKKLNKVKVIDLQIKTTSVNGTHNNVIYALEIDDGFNNLEKSVFNNLSNQFKRNLRPDSVEIKLALYDEVTRKTTILTDYKIIVDNYGNNEIFKIVGGVRF